MMARMFTLHRGEPLLQRSNMTAHGPRKRGTLQDGAIVLSERYEGWRRHSRRRWASLSWACVDHRLSQRKGGKRLLTGEDWMIDVLVIA